MISLSEVLEIHELLISEFGGSFGIRDLNLLNSALNRPFLGSGDIEFYPNLQEKAAALVESIVRNHPFIDGNKRTAYVLMRLYLIQEGFDIVASQNEKYEFVMKIADGTFEYQEITKWIESKIVKK
jgi:death-on-curing protein